MSNVIVNQKGARRIRQGHLWIFRSDLKKIDAAGGEVVPVFDEAKNFIGKAFYSHRSEISLRFVTTRDVSVDKEFWREKLMAAWDRRKGFRDGTNAFRVTSSDGDLIPSLIVDFYDGHFVIQTLSQSTEKLKNTFVEILNEEFSPASIIERNDVRVRELEGLAQTKGVLSGKAPDEITIEQDGIKFKVSLLEGQKTGSFLDQRENHFAAKKYAFGRGLDCFTFNGGFALNLAQKCESVLALDISEEAIKLARENAKLNNIENIKFQAANVFDKLRDLEKAKEKFDTIVLDPPAFVKNRSALKGAIKGYKEINLRALKLLNKGGILITCSCSFHMTEELLLTTIEQAAANTHRRIQLIEKRMQAGDHPVLLGMPESYYLKCFILRVLE